MTERLQCTAADLREKMFLRYGDELTHKHNKNHLSYRHHFRTHPSQPNNRTQVNASDVNSSTGLIRELKLRKMRTRLDKGRYH